jgi:hypothetical protein
MGADDARSVVSSNLFSGNLCECLERGVGGPRCLKQLPILLDRFLGRQTPAISFLLYLVVCPPWNESTGEDTPHRECDEQCEPTVSQKLNGDSTDVHLCLTYVES